MHTRLHPAHACVAALSHTLEMSQPWHYSICTTATWSAPFPPEPCPNGDRRRATSLALQSPGTCIPSRTLLTSTHQKISLKACREGNDPPARRHVSWRGLLASVLCIRDNRLPKAAVRSRRVCSNPCSRRSTPSWHLEVCCRLVCRRHLWFPTHILRCQL